MSESKQVSRRILLVGAGLAPAAFACSTSGQAQPPSASNGKAAIVTGSSRGIGAATAKRLALDGYSVTVNCVVNRDLAAQVVAEIVAAGGQAIWEQADVSDPAAVKRLFDANDRAFGRVDVVVSNAGIQRVAPFDSMTDEDFDRMLAVNAKGSFNVLREASRRVRDGGRIIALSSSVTQSRPAAFGAYTATKAVQQMYVGSLAKELGPRKIAVNAIAPGITNTKLTTDNLPPDVLNVLVSQVPMGRIGEPSDIANAISLLCRDDSSNWISGVTVYVNGGEG